MIKKDAVDLSPIRNSLNERTMDAGGKCSCINFCLNLLNSKLGKLSKFTSSYDPYFIQIEYFLAKTDGESIKKTNRLYEPANNLIVYLFKIKA